jgi:hypothetical protein
MERKNKASLFEDLLFLTRKGRNIQKPARAWACRFFLGIYLCLQDEKDAFYQSVKTYFSFIG